MEVEYTDGKGKPFGRNSRAQHAEQWGAYYRKYGKPSPKKTMAEKIAEREARRDEVIKNFNDLGAIMQNTKERQEGYDAKEQAQQTPFNPFGNKRFTEALAGSRNVSSIFPEEIVIEIPLPKVVVEFLKKRKDKASAKEAAKK